MLELSDVVVSSGGENLLVLSGDLLVLEKLSLESLAVLDVRVRPSGGFGRSWSGEEL